MTDIDREVLLSYLRTSFEVVHTEREKASRSDRTYYNGCLQALQIVTTRVESGDLDVRVPQVPLDKIDVPTKLKVRANAPGTSWEAAASISPEKSRRLYERILLALTTEGPATDDELRHRMRTFLHYYQYSPEGVTMRRGELVKAGWIRKTGERRKGDSGASMTVWEAVPEKKELSN